MKNILIGKNVELHKNFKTDKIMETLPTSTYDLLRK